MASEGRNYTGNKSFGCPICPDFLRRLVALIHPMRLSLMKGAHADLSSTAWQEIGVKPYFGLSGLPCLPHSFVIRTDLSRRAVEAEWRDLRFTSATARLRDGRIIQPIAQPSEFITFCSERSGYSFASQTSSKIIVGSLPEVTGAQCGRPL